MKKASKVRKAKSGGCLLVGFFAIFALAGGAMSYFMTLRPVANILAARGWNETECVITSSEVAVSSGSDGSTYRVDIHYTYEGDWGTYEGNRYDFSIGSTSGYSGKARIVEAHPPGSEVTCYVDPEDPTRSVINRSPGHFLWWGLFPIPFLAVGVGGLTFLAFSGWNRPDRRARKEQKRAARRAGLRAAGLHGASVHDAGHGALELEAEASPTMKVIGTLFIAAFWNGIVSVFVFGTIVPSFRRGDIEWFPTLFMIPFVLVGLGLMAFFFYQVLAWFNPRPHLTLADGHLTPGAETTLSWRFTGAAGRLTKLSVELEGLEQVRYRRGTNTYTDTHTFFSRELVAADRFANVHRGHVTLSLPERTMPTFDASNNDVKWQLKVRGEIPVWPDVIDDFPITVYPS